MDSHPKHRRRPLIGAILAGAITLVLLLIFLPAMNSAQLHGGPHSAMPRHAAVSRRWVYALTIGIPLTASGSVYLVLRRKRRIPMENCCRVCGYCLRGLRQPRCPECGTPFSPQG
jgi:hypothetical protein